MEQKISWGIILFSHGTIEMRLKIGIHLFCSKTSEFKKQCIRNKYCYPKTIATFREKQENEEVLNIFFSEFKEEI